MEQKILRETFKTEISKIPIVTEDIEEYFKLYEEYEKNETYKTKCWIWFNKNLTSKLKEIILKQDYWNLFYNDSMATYILKELGIKTPYKIDGEERTPFNKHIGEFVYIWNSFKREFEEQEDAEALRVKLIGEGFIELKFVRMRENETSKEYILRLEEQLKPLDHKKVMCVMDISKIGFMGSFDKKETIEGKLIFNNEKLYLMPKRSTKKGYLIRTDFYYKEI